jgi:surfactin synthase thioesterase subunit
MNRPQLFLLHFAGGNSYSFGLLTSVLKEFQTFSPELPGRGKRFHEDLLHDFDLAAADIYKQISRQISSDRFIIYGHSMGAYLALRVTNMLEKTGRRPAYLVVSGNAGPAVSNRKSVHTLAEKEFIQELESLGGMPVELKENRELYELFEPILRADFEVVEKRKMEHEPPVSVPLYAIMGSQEEDAGKIASWGKFTRSEFNYEILEGDHFFIHKHPQRMADIIRECYRKSAFIPNK